MKVHELRLALSKLSEVDSCFADSVSEAELSLLETTLKTLDDLSIEDLCAKIESGKVKKRKASTKNKATNPIKTNSINEGGVTRYLDELMSAREDNSTFEAIVRRAEKDRTIKLAEANLIARGFTGTSQQHKSKGKALKAVLDRQISDRRTAVRGGQISGLF